MGSARWAKGWTQFTEIFQAPAKATRATVRLCLGGNRKARWNGAAPPLKNPSARTAQGKARGGLSPQGWQVHPRQLSDVGAFR